MHVDNEVLEAGARLIQGTIENGVPVDDEIEWAGLDGEQGKALHAVLDEVGFHDFVGALRSAADRLPEPVEPVNPHPLRSCDMTCDVTDTARDGVVFWVEMAAPADQAGSGSENEVGEEVVG